MDRAPFEQAVYLSWAEHYGCPLEDLHQPGTVILPDAEFASTHAAHIWTIGARAFARVDPALEVLVAEAIGDRLDTEAITGHHLRATLGHAGIARTEESILRYLYPPDFRPASPPPQMLVRALTTADAEGLEALKATCTEDEVNEGEVSIDDEIRFGCFDGTRLVAVATGFRLTGFMDIGVLTDPAYRRQGLGKAVVSALCAWCIEAPIIAQYRCLVANRGSHAISESLGFSLTFCQQSIYLHPPATH
jgi:RimJ/RimL family protein N-acetyltransferase